MKTTLKSTLKALLTLTSILTLLLNGTAFAQSAFDQTAAENLALEAAGATRERALLFPTEIETEHGQTAYISIHAPPRGATAKDMQFLQIFCSTLTNQHGLTIVPRNLSRLFW